jgi:hypothetical protein
MSGLNRTGLDAQSHLGEVYYSPQVRLCIKPGAGASARLRGEALHRHNVALAKLPAAAVAWARNVTTANERGSHAVRTAAVKANGSAVTNVSSSSSYYASDARCGGAYASLCLANRVTTERLKNNALGFGDAMWDAGPGLVGTVLGWASVQSASRSISDTKTGLQDWAGGDHSSGSYQAGSYTGTAITLLLPAGAASKATRLTKATEGAAEAAQIARLSRSEEKALRSYEKRIAEHETKLAEYRANPFANDNRGFLRDAPSKEIQQNIIESRISHLEREIETFKINIRKITGGK